MVIEIEQVKTNKPTSFNVEHIEIPLLFIKQFRR